MSDSSSTVQIGNITQKWAQNHHLFTRHLDRTESTNEWARQEAFSADLLREPIALYLTEHQSKGRGRGEHSWTDVDHGSALLSSWSFLLETKPQPTASCLVGLAVYRACWATWPFLPWSLKAPNDIYIADKKVAGILIENIQQGDRTRFIVGLGLNVFNHPKEIPQAGSVLNCMPPQTPLLGEDWLCFLDRLFFELTDAASRSENPMSTTDCQSLKFALNQFPKLTDKISEVKSDGSLIIGTTKLDWTKL